MAMSDKSNVGATTKPPVTGSIPEGLDPRYAITFTADNGIAVSIMAGQTSATLTDGFGGWEAVDRPKRPGMTRWKGKPLFRQDVPVLFDGWKLGRSVEVDISKLIRMSQQAGSLMPPPTVKIDGPVERSDLTWVIENITWNSDDVLRDLVGGVSVRLRQSATVHLLQYIDDKVIVTPARPKVVTKSVDPKGKSAKQLSQETYGTPDFWKEIYSNNPGLWPDPRSKPSVKGKKAKMPNIRITGKY